MTALVGWILDAVPAIVAMVGLVAAASILLLAWRVRSSSWRAAVSTTVGDAALMAALGLVALLTLTAAPIGAQPDRVNLLPFRDQLWILEGRVDPVIGLATLLGNVTLFVPLGVALAARSPARRGWVLVLVGMAVSVGVELIQALLDIGRLADVTDVLANTFGAALGIGLWRRLGAGQEGNDAAAD